MSTKLSIFISSFIFRTNKINASLVNLSLIQKGINEIDQDNLWPKRPRDENLKLSQFIGYRASRAYLLAVLALGSLQCGALEEHQTEAWYKQMHRALKPCYEDEREEVIFAHVQIADFCRVTALSHEFENTLVSQEFY